MSTGVIYLDEVVNATHGCHPDFECWSRCWARAMAKRLQARGVRGYERGFAPTFDEVALERLLHLQRPRRIGLSFMGDLFVDGLSNEQIASVLHVAGACSQHTILALTKRAERLPLLFGDINEPVARAACAVEGMLRGRPMASVWPPPNLWAGVSISRRQNLERVHWLRRAPAAHRWLSLEPLLEDLGELDLAGIDWVVAGGESGPGSRPLELDWVRRIRDQCAAAGVPFMLKQLSGFRPEQLPELDGVRHEALPAGWTLNVLRGREPRRGRACGWRAA